MLHVVPIVDIDAVDGGEPGKVRLPHNHNLDYSEKPLYIAVSAISEYARDIKPVAFLDFHTSEKITNNVVPFLAMERPPHDAEMKKFGKILCEYTQTEKSLGKIPCSDKIDLRPDRPHVSRAFFCRLGTKLVCGLEYAHLGVPGAIVTQENSRLFGADFARAIEVYMRSGEES